jgi:hypothetical protein
VVVGAGIRPRGALNAVQIAERIAARQSVAPASVLAAMALPENRGERLGRCGGLPALLQ